MASKVVRKKHDALRRSHQLLDSRTALATLYIKVIREPVPQDLRTSGTKGGIFEDYTASRQKTEVGITVTVWGWMN